MRERPYRILICGRDNEQFDVIVPNYFANYNYVKVKGINVGISSIEKEPNIIGLFCNDHCYNATYGNGMVQLHKDEFNYFMFNIISLLNGSKSVYTYLPYRNKYSFYLSNLSEDPWGSVSDLTLILELEPINFN